MKFLNRRLFVGQIYQITTANICTWNNLHKIGGFYLWIVVVWLVFSACFRQKRMGRIHLNQWNFICFGNVSDKNFDRGDLFRIPACMRALKRGAGRTERIRQVRACT